MKPVITSVALSVLLVGSVLTWTRLDPSSDRAPLRPFPVVRADSSSELPQPNESVPARLERQEAEDKETTILSSVRGNSVPPRPSGIVESTNSRVELESQELAITALRPTPIARLVGTIRSTDDRGIEGAFVLLQIDNGSRDQDRTTTTNHHGEFSIELPTTTEAWRLTATHPDHSPASRFVRVPVGQTVADVQLFVGRGVRGIVRTRDGKPIAGAELTVPGEGGHPELSRSTTTSSDGRYFIGGLSRGAHQLMVRAQGFARSNQSFSVENEFARSVSVTMDAERVQTGLVVDPQGAAVPGAAIEVRFAGTEWELASEADDFGRFEIAELGTERIDFRVSETGFTTFNDSGVLGHEAPLRVELEPGVEVVGVVVAENTNQPIASAALYWSPRDDSAVRSLGGRVIADSEGRFLTAGLSPGSWSVTVSGPQHQTRTFELVLSESTSRVFALAEGRELRGRVVDVNGDAIEGVRVHATSDVGTPEVRAAQTDSDGRFLLSGLGREEYRVVFQHVHYAQRIVPVTVEESGQTWSLELGARISGRVERAGRSLRQQVVARQIDGTHLARKRVDPNGNFSIDGLPAGFYRLELNGTGISTEVQLAVGQRAVHNISVSDSN